MVPSAIKVITVGRPAFSAKATASLDAPECTTPPPRYSIGFFDSLIIAAARAIRSVGGKGTGSALPGSGHSLTSMRWFCTSLGISISTGPGRPDAARRKACGMTVSNSSAEPTRKLCLVIGMVRP